MLIETIPSDWLTNACKPVTMDGETVFRSDFLLRAIKLVNTYDAPIRVESIALTAMVGGKAIMTVAYGADRIVERAAALLPLMDPFEKNPDNELGHFGTTGFWGSGKFAASCDLKPDEVTGFMLEHLVVPFEQPVDTLSVAVEYTLDGDKQKEAMNLPVKEHQSANQYILPVRGTWLVVNNWDDFHGHRDSISQEFAIDLVQPNEEGLFPLDRANTDYGFYGVDILAAASGEVVVVKDFCPENPRAGVKTELDVKAVYREHGMKALTAGNHVIIKHPGGEYSFYAHLIRGTIHVAEGDTVKQGDVIGSLGNSGNSDAPHLHFHLMDHAELGARGLPCRFTNIVDSFKMTCDFISQNFSTVKTID